MSTATTRAEVVFISFYTLALIRKHLNGGDRTGKNFQDFSNVDATWEATKASKEGEQIIENLKILIVEFTLKNKQK